MKYKLTNDEIWDIAMSGNVSKLVELLTQVSKGDIENAKQTLSILHKEVFSEQL